MKREFLKELGLEKEVIDKIMEENGKDINSTKEDMQSELNNKDTEIKNLNNQLAEVQKEIKTYQDLDVDAIKGKAKELEDKLIKAEEALQTERNNTILQKALAGSNAHDLDLLTMTLDQSKLIFKDGAVEGLEEQIKVLQESKPFLFKEVKESKEETNPTEEEKETELEMFKPGTSQGTVETKEKTYVDFLEEVESN